MSTLTDLTPGEKLVLRRRRDNHNQVEAAEKLGVGLRTYRRWEQDEEVPPRTALRALGVVPLHEQCYLARRRKGVQRQQLAKKLKVSRLWITLMEQGKAPVALLANYWKLS